MPDIVPAILPKRAQDITGQKFNRLTAIRFLGYVYSPSGGVKQMWEFLCECGKITQSVKNNITNNHTQSCGCYRHEMAIKARTKHGDAKKENRHPLYKIWCRMKERCNNKNNRSYKDYGGRGISVEWKDYDSFKRDMLDSFRVGLQIERKNNNGPYSKSNCCWATHKEQQRNTSRNLNITFEGKTFCVGQWSEITGIQSGTIRWRYHSGWPIEKVLTP